MIKYQLDCVKAVESDLSQISKIIRPIVVDAINTLAEEPLPANARQLLQSGLFVVRPRDCRVLYAIRGNIVTILAVKTKHRQIANG